LKRYPTTLDFTLLLKKIAKHEFSKLYAAIECHYPKAFKSLTSNKNNGYLAIDWLKIHSTIEEDHFKSALICVDMIKDHLKNSKSIVSLNLFEECFSNGFNDFVNYSHLKVRASWIVTIPVRFEFNPEVACPKQ
jgi:hypothetical protein